MKILVTGHAGFIGSALTLRLLERGDEVIGIDNVNDYYDPSLKMARLALHKDHKAYSDLRIDITDKTAIENVFRTFQPRRVVNLAAQPGVRYSLVNPYAYINTNIVGFINILEACRHHVIEHLVFASSSSVYGANTRLPYSEHDNVDHPVSLYAATKKSNELMAHTYSHLYGIPATGLRFFTVYGPWGRPDMAFFIFTKAILENRPIELYNEGNMTRDFTYIDDVVEGIVRVIDSPAEPNPEFRTDTPDPATSTAPYRIFNIGSNRPVKLMQYIEAIESTLGRVAKKKFLPMQPGDVSSTCADVNGLASAVAFKPSITVEEGIKRFCKWYRKFYNV